LTTFSIHAAPRWPEAVRSLAVGLMLSAEEQSAFVRELPDVFVPVAGGWGRNGATHIVLAKASEDVLRDALKTAWRLRVEANARSGKRAARKMPRR
jgi:hypothetical protein